MRLLSGRIWFSLAIMFSASGIGCGGEETAPKEDVLEETQDSSGADTGLDVSADGLTEDSVASDLLAQTDGADDTADSVEGEMLADTTPPARLSAYECLNSTTCNQIIIAAHRGDHILYPEASLAAIRGAAALGADLVELDTRITKDGVIVLMHDSTVDRTTDGTGDVQNMTWPEVQALNLKGADPTNPETQKVPTFDQALALSSELGLMIYVDNKVGDWSKLAEVIRDGGYQQVALVRDDLNVILDMAPTCSDLMLMPATETIEQVQQVLAVLPTLKIVELSYAEAKPEFVAAVHALGVKVQQDVMATGDVFATLGQTSGWKTFLDAGVNLWQTDLPAKLIPVVRAYEETGVWPVATVD